ncbi:hypothetical protein [Variovorax paradoxus]|uniref:Uncharacterized protein n=1 Tax=Variovorax paradoxus (strain EPS) TaxID=595537 RepID=E6UV63_VARPE|nr:hypothetical protein [Variovorax paradoxus]ADU37575.1 hypothetical protein Varpa_3390 [Variovorax paradoxus EPS]
MRASMHLMHLHNATQGRIRRLQRLYGTTVLINAPHQNHQLGYLAIELDNLVISVLREFTISTIRQAKTRIGARIRVNQSLGPEEQIAAYILSIVNPVKYRRLNSPQSIRQTDEQTIRDPKETEKILSYAGATNLPSLQNALALNSGLFKNLKSIRHFYAHRGKDTFGKASVNAVSMGVLNTHHPDDILMYVISGRPHSVLEEWLIDASLFFELLME